MLLNILVSFLSFHNSTEFGNISIYFVSRRHSSMQTERKTNTFLSHKRFAEKVRLLLIFRMEKMNVVCRFFLSQFNCEAAVWWSWSFIYHSLLAFLFVPMHCVNNIVQNFPNNIHNISKSNKTEHHQQQQWVEQLQYAPCTITIHQNNGDQVYFPVMMTSLRLSLSIFCSF